MPRRATPSKRPTSARFSAGVLLYRRNRGDVEVLLVHPGGPFWAKKDSGSWTIPKGEPAVGEHPVEAAFREFREETGIELAGPCLDLGIVKQAGGKHVQAFAKEGDCDPSTVRSNLFTMEWPPRSGREQSFPEIDRAEWFSLKEARSKINAAQARFLDVLQECLSA